jgi:hypothetical protein
MSSSFSCQLQALFVIGSAKVRVIFDFPNFKAEIFISVSFSGQVRLLLKRVAKVEKLFRFYKKNFKKTSKLL